MQQAFLTVDLGFGDAGKGSVVDYLTRAHAAHTVIRYNGGAQAGHRVVTPGQNTPEHVFAQFGAGTLAGAATHLSRFMLLDPLAMMAEEAHLRMMGVGDAFGRTTIDQRALIITPFQRAVNRLREVARGDGRHGSCGMGIGETMIDTLAYGDQVLRAGDLACTDRLVDRLAFLREINRAKVAKFQDHLPDGEQTEEELAVLEEDGWLDWLMEAYKPFIAQARIVHGDHLHEILARPGTVIFEGAQGVLLDEWRGFHPHTTWSTITLDNAETLLAEASYAGQVTRMGITRAYATRHGAGPFVSEDAPLTAALPDPANGYGDWQEGFRVGWLDLVMLDYAAQVAGRLDTLAITCLDRLADLPDLHVCTTYAQDTLRVDRILPNPSPQDLAYQARITQGLATCRPILEPVADEADLLTRITAKTGLPVGLRSYGPTALDKKSRR